MTTPLVSVIIPVYKVEPYLRKCLDSIVCQSYTNLEVILVDDGSPDDCPQICDEYAIKDNRVIVLHKENGGLSDARNAGLDICKGEYISFIDSDDWVNEKYIEYLLQLSLNEDADIAICNFKDAYNDECNLNHPSFEKHSVFNSSELLYHLCKADLRGIMPTWGKIYSRNCFAQIRFPKGKLYEDARTNYKIYSTIKKACYTNVELYFYRIRNDSIMGTTNSSVHCLDATIERYTFLKHKGDLKVLEAALSSLCWDLLFSFNKLFHGESVPYFTNKEDVLSFYRERVNEYYSLSKITTDLIIHKIFARFPHLYIFYRKVSPFVIRKK